MYATEECRGGGPKKKKSYSGGNPGAFDKPGREGKRRICRQAQEAERDLLASRAEKG